MPILQALVRIRQAGHCPDAVALQAKLKADIATFQAAAEAAQYPQAEIASANYVLCAALDEAALGTPWGRDSQWSTRPLLAQLHGETWGGERVFRMLEEARGAGAARRALVELVDLCLSLGFLGRYGLMDNGLVQLDLLRAELRAEMANSGRDKPLRLAPAVEGAGGTRRMRGYVPLWVAASVAGFIALLAYGRLTAELQELVSITAGGFESVQPPGWNAGNSP